MSYLNSNSVFIFTVAFFLLNLCGCKTIYNSEFVQPPVQPVSGPIEIGPEWVEIIPPKPLIPYGDYQEIAIAYHNFYPENLSDDPYKGEVLNLTNGKKTKIEAYLYDDKGESYKLVISGRTLIRTDDDKLIPGTVDFKRELVKKTTINGGIDYDMQHFPNDRTYIKLRIRSEINLKCDYVEWNGTNNKH